MKQPILWHHRSVNLYAPAEEDLERLALLITRMILVTAEFANGQRAVESQQSCSPVKVVLRQIQAQSGHGR